MISKNLTSSEACLQLTEISEDSYSDEGHLRHDCSKIACIRLSMETCLTFCRDLHRSLSLMKQELLCIAHCIFASACVSCLGSRMAFLAS